MPCSRLVLVFVKVTTPSMAPVPVLVQEKFVTGPPEEVQLRVNTGGSSSGPEISENAVSPVQSTVTVPAENSGSDWLVQPLLEIRD